MLHRRSTASSLSGFIFGRGNLSQVARYDVTDPTNAQDTWQETKWRHNSTGSVLMERDHLWHAVYFEYADSFTGNVNLNTFGYPTRVTDEDGFQSTVKYNYATGAVVQTTRPSSGTHAAGNTTTETVVTAYDAVGRVDRVTNQNNGAYTRFVYPASQTYVQTYSTITDGENEAYSFTHFDGAGRVFTQAGDHPGSTTNYRARWIKYDEMGRAVEHSNPTEINSTGVPSGDDAGVPVVWTLQAYDWQGRPTLQTNPDNSTTELSYGGCGCAGGETVTSRDERGRRRKLYKDGLGRLSKVEELNWNQTVYSSATYTYNARDQLTQINHGGQLRTFEYDGHGRLRRRTTPEQGVTVYDYNRDDTLQRATDARGASATYGYNNRHLPTSITYGVPSGVAPTSNVAFEYDSAGNRTRMTDGQGYVTYSYDSLSRLSSESRHFTALGQSYPLTYSYDLAGQLTSYTDHRGSKVTYGYDNVGRVKSITGSGPSSAAAYAPDLRYRAFDALRWMSYNNGRALSVSYDNRMRVKRWDVPSVVGFEYSYASDFYQEKTGRVIYAKSLYDATLDRSYEYDHVGRLTVSHTGAEARAHVGIPAGSQWNQMDGPYSHGYEYDARGNLLRRYGWGGLLGGTPGSSNQQVKSYDANNRQTDLQHDAAGNITNEVSQTFTYDATGQQATALTYFGLQVNQWYDGGRLRVKKQDGGATTFYVRSSALGGQVVAELTGAGAWQRGYVYGAGGELLAIRTNEGVRWAHQDPATKSQRLTDSSGAVAALVDLDPWGGETTRSQNSALQPRKFTSYERDSNASDEAMHRRYSRRHGRFDQPDPADFSYDLSDPQSLNRYSYVRNDPVNFVDPLGLCTFNIMISNNNQLDPKKLQVMKDEISRIYAEAGHQINFVTRGQADYRLSIIPVATSLYTNNPDAVGSTPLVPGTIMVRDYGYVFVDRLRRSATEDPASKLQFDQNTNAMAIGLGRAGAHEIGHYLFQQGTHPRSITGVMRPSFKGHEWFSNTTRSMWAFMQFQLARLSSLCAPIPESPPTPPATQITPRSPLPLPGDGGGLGGGMFGGIGSLAVLSFEPIGTVSTEYVIYPPRTN